MKHILVDWVGSFYIQGGPKIGTLFIRFVLLIILSNIDQFSNTFHCQNQQKIRNNIVTTDSATPHMCRYTTL